MNSHFRGERLGGRTEEIARYANQLIVSIFNDNKENIYDYRAFKQRDEDYNTHLELEHVSGKKGYFFIVAQNSEINVNRVIEFAADKYRRDGKTINNKKIVYKIAGIKWEKN